MSFFESIRFFWDSLGYVTELIEACDLSGCTSERDAEDRLYEYLHEKLSSTQVVRQYGRARAKVDLMVNDEVMIEIKFGLRTTSEYQRLKGQIDDYLDWKKVLIIVLVGQSDPALVKDLKTFIEKVNTQVVILDEGNIRLIEKHC